MRLPLSLTVLSAMGAAVAISAVPASAATTNVQEATSQNWAGYVASGTQFSSVSGSWVQPSATCTAGSGDSAFWVGLGGSADQSQSLEQVGTQSNCTGSGQDQYYAWYELVPAAPVRLGLTIHPGDHISARVAVDGNNVTVALSDQTTGGSVSKTLQMDNPDTSSADWVAEAPSACDESGNCQPVSLADFGTVTFSNASATAGGHTGAISDPSWTAQAVQLNPDGGGPTFASAQSSAAGATPSGLSQNGASFSVGWQSDQATSAGNGDGAGGYGYGSGGSGYGSGGSGGGYGSGGYGGYGYGGYGSGGYGGYGSGGYGGYGYGGYGSGAGLAGSYGF